MGEWRETWRGAVKAWECDAFGHLTIAYYFDRVADAAAAMVAELGQEPSRWRIVEVVTRYAKELVAHDGLHVESGLLEAAPDRLRFAHRLCASATGEVASLVETRLAAVPPGGVAPAVPLSAVAWEELTEGRTLPADAADEAPVTARDRIAAAELDETGGLALSGYVHRFTNSGVQLFAQSGMTAQEMRKARRGFATFETWLRLEAPPPPAGTLVRVSARVLELGNSSARLLHRMADARSGRHIATFYQSTVHFDLEKRRATAWPEAFRTLVRDRTG